MHISINLDDYHWLTGQDGCAWLDHVTGSDRPLHQLVTELRQHLSSVRAHLVLEQVELRRQATRKFAHAAIMFFTKRGLEQATDGWIAAYKASRFPPNQQVADLCCGIGGDLIGLAERGPAIGVEIDPRVAALAGANLQNVLGREAGASRVVVEKAESFDIAGVSAWHCDPDRRPTGRRTTRVALHVPDISSILAILASNPNGAMKLAPGSDAPRWIDAPRMDQGDQQEPDHFRVELLPVSSCVAQPSINWPHAIEWEWICRGRECRQLVGWFGNLARHPGKHVATIVFPDSQSHHSFAGSPEAVAQSCETMDRYIYVPNPAVFAARLDAAIAVRYGLFRIGATHSLPSGYLTGSRFIHEPLLDGFEVIDILPLDIRHLGDYLRTRRIGRLEIKHRGLPLDPGTFRHQLHLRGDRAATLLATPAGSRSVAVLAQRCNQR
ncbi:MAG: hypothetical protein JW829_20825 [Pirellulales bacterium]|nr:hypothetical protein [Pirellulales bacterium]